MYFLHICLEIDFDLGFLPVSLNPAPLQFSYKLKMLVGDCAQET